ncbi:hypothetical protein K505DRAFT_204389, partial [Melanomma pulvis-pyrius CBS 109.77]
EKLLALYQKDADLIPLYRRVIEDTSREPERLRRNSKRLFKKYARSLKGEEADELEFLASQLVSLKAAFLSQHIVEVCVEIAAKLKKKTPQVVQDSIGDRENERNDEGEQATSVDDINCGDLFREFVASSIAFNTFRTEMANLALPKPSRTTKKVVVDKKDVMEYVQTKTAVIAGRILHILKESLVATGYLEPPLKPRMVRLRWECRCGERFTADAREYEAGGASELTASAEALIGSRVTATLHSTNSSNQKLILPQPRLWLQRVFARLATTFKRPPSPSTLPQHNPNTTVTHAPQEPPLQPPKLLHLLACMRSAQLGKSLHQASIAAIDTDRNLFRLLRDQFRSHRGRFCTLLSLKKVHGISFVKFNLFAGGSVEVRHHSPCCESACECIPPRARVEPSHRAEYRCSPAGPLRGGPPVLPDILAHFFARPACIPEHNVSILNRLPKRICGELQGSAAEPAEGWGIYYQEGWDGDIIAMVVFVMFLVVSLLFGVLWACLEMDVQGAFGVSAYIMTAS